MFDDASPQHDGLIDGTIRLSLPSIPTSPSTGFSIAPILARRVQRRAVERYRKLLSNLLAGQGGEAWFGTVIHDADEDCWMIDFQAADPQMVISLHEAAMDVNLSPCGLYGFDADELIRDWLTRIETNLRALLSA